MLKLTKEAKLEDNFKLNLNIFEERRSVKKVGRKVILLKRRNSRFSRVISFDPDLCVRCRRCEEVCNLISVRYGFDESCYLCGLCADVCFYNAIKLYEGGRRVRCIRPIAKIEFDENFCKGDECDGECVSACPRKAVSQSFKASFIEDLCFYCRRCEKACEHKAVEIIKPFSGFVEINKELCDECGKCYYVCPSNAITPNFEVVLDYCIFCGLCAKVCDKKAVRMEVKLNFEVDDVPWKKSRVDALKRLGLV